MDRSDRFLKDRQEFWHRKDTEKKAAQERIKPGRGEMEIFSGKKSGQEEKMFDQAALDQDVGKDHERQKGGNQSEKPQVQSHFCTFKDQTREKQQNHKQGSTKK